MRKPQPISLVDELYANITSDNKMKKAWFYRKMEKLPADQQEEIWEALEKRGISKAIREKSSDDESPSNITKNCRYVSD